jgi:hypothetical protein
MNMLLKSVSFWANLWGYLTLPPRQVQKMMTLLAGFFFCKENDTNRGLPALMIACKLVPNINCPFFGNCSKSGNQSYFYLLFTAHMYLRRGLLGEGSQHFLIRNWPDLLLFDLANLVQV